MDDLPELEAKLRKRCELRDAIDKDQQRQNELEAVNQDIAKRCQSFEEIRNQYAQAMELLDAQRAALEATIAAADRASIVITHDPIDPATLAEQDSINVRLRELGSQRNRITPHLNASLQDSPAWLLRREEIRAKRLREKNAPAHELLIVENAVESYRQEVERWQQTLAPIEDEIASLHAKAKSLEEKSLTP